MDLRNTQIALPLEYNEKYINDRVKQHWNVTFARQRKVSVYAKRIMARVLSMIKASDKEFPKLFQFHISEIANPGQDKSSIYKEIKKAFDELTDLKWLLEDKEKESFTMRHLLNTSDANLGYSNGWITVVLNPLLQPYFVCLAKNYTTYQLKWYMCFQSWYSMRIFELLSAFKDTGIWIVDMKEYRELMDCNDKYKAPKDLIKHTLQEPVEELEKTDLAFTYDPIYGYKATKGRAPIVQLEFRLKNVEIKKIPEKWYQFSDEHKKILMDLKKFKVNEASIVKYAKAIGMETAKKLIKEWKDKENSQRKIDSYEKYCNTVWTTVGEKALLKN